MKKVEVLKRLDMLEYKKHVVEDEELLKEYAMLVSDIAEKHFHVLDNISAETFAIVDTKQEAFNVTKKLLPYFEVTIESYHNDYILTVTGSNCFDNEDNSSYTMECTRDIISMHRARDFERQRQKKNQEREE
jgi:hypothetical protein